MRLRAMPSAAQEEDDEEAIIARIRVLLRGAKKSDEEKGFPDFTLGEGEAFADLKNQSGRCAVDTKDSSHPSRSTEPL